MNELFKDHWTDEEKDDLLSRGFTPGWMFHVDVGDIVSIPSISRFRPEENLPEEGMVVAKVMSPPGDITTYDEGVIPHCVINFIFVGQDERPVHRMFGNTYPIMIKKR